MKPTFCITQSLFRQSAFEYLVYSSLDIFIYIARVSLATWCKIWMGVFLGWRQLGRGADSREKLIGGLGGREVRAGIGFDRFGN